jgi:PIN domain nuclease of toxin-antitoxin system
MILMHLYQIVFGWVKINMKYLLDTHTFIWWHDNPDLLSEKVLRLCEDVNNELFLSLVSVWEMQIKLQLNKLTLVNSLVVMLETEKNNAIEILPISLNHIMELDGMPLHHKDPFDRLLIAQAVADDLVLLSKDEHFASYPVKCLW